MDDNKIRSHDIVSESNVHELIVYCRKCGEVVYSTRDYHQKPENFTGKPLTPCTLMRTVMR